MAYFPFFIDIKGKPCLIVGGGKVAKRKAVKLLEYEAQVTILAPKIEPELEELQAVTPSLRIIKKEYEQTDLKGSFLVAAATNDAIMNAAVMRDAKELGILGNNSIQQVDEGDFLFPATVKKGDLSIGITTSGNSPDVSAWLRRQIEEMLPEDIDEKIKLLGKLRDELKTQEASEAQRRKLCHQRAEAILNQNIEK